MKLKYSIAHGWTTNDATGEDRGRQFGDGLFETIRLNGRGEAPLWALHLRRLARGLKALRFSDSAVATVFSALDSLSHPQMSTACKLIVTRGVTERGYAFSDDLEPVITITYFDAAALISKPMSAGLSDVALSGQRALAGHKHLNRLEQVLARAAFEKEWDEAIMLSQTGLVVEGCMTNVFVKLDDEWHTPELNECGIDGVVRQWLLSQNTKIQVRAVSLEELRHAEAAVVTNSLIGVRSMGQFEGKLLDISPESREWQTAYQELFI